MPVFFDLNQCLTHISVATDSAAAELVAAREVRRQIANDRHRTADPGFFFFDRLFLPLMLRKAYDDKDRQEDAIRSSTLDWTLVRPTVLNDKPARGKIKALTDLSGVHGGTIARADVADFVVQQLTTNTWLCQAPLIKW